MWTILLSVALSAITAVAITAKAKKDILNYVEEICNLNIEQTEKIKDLALNKIEEVINRCKHG